MNILELEHSEVSIRSIQYYLGLVLVGGIVEEHMKEAYERYVAFTRPTSHNPPQVSIS